MLGLDHDRGFRAGEVHLSTCCQQIVRRAVKSSKISSRKVRPKGFSKAISRMSSANKQRAATKQAKQHLLTSKVHKNALTPRPGHAKSEQKVDLTIEVWIPAKDSDAQRSEKLEVRKGDDPGILAREFALKYGLGRAVERDLAGLLKKAVKEYIN